MKKSATCLERAKKHMPLGVADSYRYWGEEDTVFVQSMKAGGFRDVDGQEFIDFRLAYGPIILGYRDERVDAAVIDSIQHIGSMCGFSVEMDSDVCELIKELCPQMELMRFANSGTEAVLGSIRTARGYTGKQKILQVEGGFHGLFDEMMWKADIENWEKEKGDPDIISFGAGLGQKSREDVDLVPLNCHESIEKVFGEKGDDIAAVIIEPIMGNCGSIMATKEYMQFLRRKCDEYNAVLIIDEVKTGFRVGLGGVQEFYGVYADLTTFAKAMGNGYPIAVFGGKKEMMEKISFDSDGVVHGGTYTANLIGLAAAKETLTILKNTDALKTIDRVGGEIKEVLSKVFTEFDIAHCFSGPNSMFGVHFGESVPTNYRDWKSTKADLYTIFAKNLIKKGIMLEPDSREPWFICEAHQDIDLESLYKTAVSAMGEALESYSKKES
jgi:glutamate-1-semialdehyde 2,1-aminomutase